MTLPTFDDDVAIIAALDNLPNDVGGLSASQLKAKFDEASTLLKAFLNSDLIPKLPEVTTANLTYYVRTDGSDSNNGLANTAGGAFLTITKALSVIPQIPNHTVTINVANGTYAETVNIKGFYGKGSITLTGNTSSPSSVSVVQIVQENNYLPVIVTGFIATTTADAGFYVNNCKNFMITVCHCTSAAATEEGVWARSSQGTIELCTLSNRQRAIYATNVSHVQTFFNTGSGNTIGLSYSSSNLYKVSSQPSGTTAESGTVGEIYG